ncbi:MAG: glycosyltransferase [Salana multivorans]|uniref:glycosyltransferase family 2 protein n=1 Tax=Salana multivorans TaxID=120377 RepID=UPI000961D24B|nr:glycosyltransferase family 2 protein [Salana multivorans]MBN8882100.1 glycosyltransferase [Salana multivorans]OJX97058.1 MAG: glycosyltransferase [Micrococcales bacterium 73-15]
MAIMHDRPSTRKIVLGRVAILVTVGAWSMYVVTTVMREFIEGDARTLRFVLEAVSYLLVVTFLTFSALMYLTARQGALYRFRDHVRVPRGPLDQHFAGDYAHAITVLVPSYREEPDVLTKTMWSAALQEFPAKRIVLLVDDPPDPGDPRDRELLQFARDLPARIAAELEEPRARLAAGAELLRAELARAAAAGEDRVDAATLARVADDHEFAADWLEAKADAHPMTDHMDAFFADRVLVGLAGDLRLTRIALDGALDQGASPPPERVQQLQDRLVRIFTAELTSFERKRFASLSHEANKAMNLNAYIGLMGRRWSIERTADGDVLVPTPDGEPCDLDVPGTEYLLTLDADSMLLRDYCVRLVHLLEEPGNERVAVAQTPYSAYRGAPSRIERIAGATTDVQHILHQGLTYYDATFWVGANAVIRRRALDDIVERQTVGGFEVATYIQDRTVIEDTESSIDLGTHGWRLVNYPERLSYSATPPDFGSLIVQRRRWADGGLLILPKLSRQLRERRFRREPVLRREVMLRVNYMASIAWASVGLVFLLAYPYDSRLLSAWVIGAAAPYFLCMAADLRDSGHRASDVLRIYGFNLVLLAVNLAGTLKSLQQAMTNTKIPFARTPKVRSRTAAPAIYVLVPYVIVAFSAVTFYRDLTAHNWGNAAFAAINAVLCAWAIVAYIGIRSSIVDVALGIVGWLYVPERPARRPAAPSGDRGAATDGAPRPVDWEGILYHGDRRLGRDVARKNDLRRRVSPR